MRDEEGRKKEASKVKQTTRKSNTAHPRQSLFQTCTCECAHVCMMRGDVRDEMMRGDVRDELYEWTHPLLKDEA